MNIKKVLFTGALCALVGATLVAQGGQHTALRAWGEVMIPPLDKNTRFKAIASGSWHNLAITTNNTVIAWGHNYSYGQCDVPVGLSNVIAVTAGIEHSVALKDNGTVVAWGSPVGGVSTVPPGLSNVTAIAAGYNHTLALKADGTVISWGHDMDKVPLGLSNVVAIAAGWRRSVALTAGKNVIHWGVDGIAEMGATNITAITHSYGLRADGTVVPFGTTPTPPIGLSNVVAIAAGAKQPSAFYHALALKADGTVVAWKVTDWEYDEFVKVPAGLKDVSAIAAGCVHSLVLKQDGTLVAWGESTRSQSIVPTDFNDVAAISAGVGHQLVLRKDGTVFAWGAYPDGQIDVPAGLSNVIAVAAGGAHSVALKANGRVVIWGEPQQDQNTVITNLTGFVAIAAGRFHGLALSASGNVWMWGSDSHGQRQVPQGLSNVVAIAAGEIHSVALKSDGTVLTWGSIKRTFTNYNDIVAIDHTLLLRSNGVIVPFARGESGLKPMSNIVAMASGRTHDLVLTRDSTVIAAGDNTYGQSSVPADLKHVVAIEAGWGTSFALVNIAPEISSQVTGGNLVLSWPVSLRNYTIQSTSDFMAADSWADVENDVVVENNQNVITLPVGDGQRFFRLVRVED